MAKKRKTKKERLIERIQTIIQQNGNFTTADVEAQSSPVYKTINNNIHALIESFKLDDVEVIYYVRAEEVYWEYVAYKELDVDTLEEILLLAEEWSAECYKTNKRISN